MFDQLKKKLAEWIAPALPANPLIVNLIEHVGYLEQQHKRDYHLKEAEKMASAQRDAELWELQKAHYHAVIQEIEGAAKTREADQKRWALERAEALEAANNGTQALKAIEKAVLRLTAQDVPGKTPVNEDSSEAKTVKLVFSICGEKIPVEANVADLLSVALTWAIEHSPYVGHSIDKFDARDVCGLPLHSDTPIRLNFKEGDQIFLALKSKGNNRDEF